MKIRNAVSDPTVARDERLEKKGIPLDPSTKYYNDVAGLDAMKSALKDMMDEGVDIQNNPKLKTLYENVTVGKGKLLKDNADFTKQQAARLISDKIYKDKNWFQTMTGLYTVNNDDIKKAAKELNIPDDVTNLVSDKDIHTANIFGTFANEIAAKPGANLGSMIGRPWRKFVLGQDRDAVDYHYDELKKKYTSALADAPDADSQFGNQTEVQGDRRKENYLEDVKSEKAGKFNWSPTSIANSISGGTAQMLQYGLGANATGGLLKGLNVVNDIEKANKVGLVTYGFLNAYDDSYQDARQLVGDDPDKKGTRHIVAFLKSGVQAFSELIFPDYEVTNKLFGSTSKAANILLDQLANKGTKGLTEKFTKNTVVTAIKEGLIKTGKGTLQEVGEEEAGLAGDLIVSALFNKKSLDDRNIPQEIMQTAVATAVSSVIPIGAGEFRQNHQTSSVKKSMLYDIGDDPGTYIADINHQILDGKMSQPVADKKFTSSIKCPAL